MTDPHAGGVVGHAGEVLEHAAGAVVMLHGRGALAEDVLSLANHFSLPGVCWLAPQENGNTWYPYSFLMPIEQNQPYLSSALATVQRTIDLCIDAGLSYERIALLGFSQGACLASEYVARNTRRYGGLIAFSGGLIGPAGTPRDYPGSLDGTPVFLGCSDVDPHIPVERVNETAAVLEELGARVDKRIYPGMAHTINVDEIKAAQQILAQLICS